MPVTIEVKASEESIRAARRASAQRVLEATEFERLPDLKLLACFDDEDSEFFKQALGPDNRGVFISDTMAGTRGLPTHFANLLSARNPNSPLDDPESVFFFDAVIYIHGSTSAEQTALIMTFAHELQHLVQFGAHRNLWEANKLRMSIPGIKIRELPIEQEAKIVAKRVTQKLCGADLVHQYILRKIADAVTNEDTNDWEWIRQLNPSTAFDLARETHLAGCPGPASETWEQARIAIIP